MTYLDFHFSIHEVYVTEYEPPLPVTINLNKASFKFSTSEHKNGKYIFFAIAPTEPVVSPKLLVLFTTVIPLNVTADSFALVFPNDLFVDTSAVIGMNGLAVVLPFLNLSFEKYSICPSENTSDICSPLPFLVINAFAILFTSHCQHLNGQSGRCCFFCIEFNTTVVCLCLVYLRPFILNILIVTSRSNDI